MKTTVILTPENATTIAWCAELTGLPAEELINFFLAEYFQNFNQTNSDSYVEETIGCMKFKDRGNAERTLDWVIDRVRCRYPIIESEIRELKDGRFEIDAFKTNRNGERERVC